MNNGPQVYSRRKGASSPPSDAVYVGRPTIYGNPFIVGKDGQQEECVQLYRKWIYETDQDWLRLAIKDNLKGRDLECWCSPLPCHADVLLEVANGQ